MLIDLFRLSQTICLQSPALFDGKSEKRKILLFFLNLNNASKRTIPLVSTGTSCSKAEELYPLGKLLSRGYNVLQPVDYIRWNSDLSI